MASVSWKWLFGWSLQAGLVERGSPVVCSLEQWSAGSGGIRCSRDGRKNPSYLLGPEAEEAFSG